MKPLKNGIFLLCLSNLFFGLLPVTVKWADGLGYSSVQVTFFRFAFATTGILLLAALGWQKLRIVNFRALFWRGFFGGGTVICYFLALHWTTVAEATLLNYTYSLWANIFSVLLLRQKAPKGLAILLVMAALGVWLVLGTPIPFLSGIGAIMAHPSTCCLGAEALFDHLNKGDLAGFLSGIMGGAGVLCAKEARRTDNALSVFGSFTFFGLLISAFLLAGGGTLFGTDPQLTHWTTLEGKGLAVLCAMGALAMAAQLFYTQGMGLASLAMVTLLAQAVPVLAALGGWFILGEPLTPHFILGSILVLTACLLLGAQEGKVTKGGRWTS
ncbi:MAG TPA: DMT family transporter [bacterium]